MISKKFNALIHHTFLITRMAKKLPSKTPLKRIYQSEWVRVRSFFASKCEEYNNIVLRLANNNNYDTKDILFPDLTVVHQNFEYIENIFKDSDNRQFCESFEITKVTAQKILKNIAITSYLSKDCSTKDDINKVTRIETLIASSIKNELPGIPKFWLKYHITKKLFYQMLQSFNFVHQIGTKNSINRSIKFPAGYQQAGIAILNYFAVIVEQQYPDIEVSLTIKQEGKKVILEVETPNGTKETIEKALDEYGQVIVGNKSPESLLLNDIQTIALRQKLEIAKMEAKHNYELLKIERKQYNARICSLENELKRINDSIGLSLSSTNALVESIANIGATSSKDTSRLLGLLVSILNNGVSEFNNTEIKNVLEKINSKEPDTISKLKTAVENISYGISSNIAYNWLLNILNAIPK